MNTNPSEKSLVQILLLLGVSSLLIETLGRIQGFLLPLVFVLGALTIFLSFYHTFFWIKILSSELKSLKPLWILFWICQFFWAFFKAPLDVDGLFYHLTLVLEALQKNQWGNSDILTWHIQNSPHLGEIPTLLWTGFFKCFDFITPVAFRFSQWGHLTTLVLFIAAIYRLAQRAQFKNLALFTALLISMPLVIKQAFSHYVDFFSWTTWLVALSLIINPVKKHNSILLCFSIFLHTGTKFSGLLTALPLIFIQVYLLRFKVRAYFLHSLLGIALGASVFMLPNLIRHHNPVFPLFEFSEAIPKELGISSDLKAPLQNLPTYLVPIKALLTFEEVAVYDQNQGAWGLIGALSFFSFLLLIVLQGKNFFKLPSEPKDIISITLLLYFVLMPGRTVPRHGFALGLAFIFYTWPYITAQKAFSKGILSSLLALQLIYAMPDRVLFRGAKNDLAQIKSNFVDIIKFGEPQKEGLYFHYPYLPELRKNEPRSVVVGPDGVNLPAVYYGRHFLNHVSYLPEYCRFPFCK